MANSNQEPSAGKIALYSILILGALMTAGWLLGWFHLAAERPMARYREETRAQTYDSSRQYQQGTNRDLAQFCDAMKRADTTASKKAIAAHIRSTISTYDGPLSDDNKACVSDAKSL